VDGHRDHADVNAANAISVALEYSICAWIASRDFRQRELLKRGMLCWKSPASTPEKVL